MPQTGRPVNLTVIDALCGIPLLEKHDPSARNSHPTPRRAGAIARLVGIELDHPPNRGNPILRHFCPECGSSIAEEPGTRPGMIILNVGTFDDPTVAKPGREIFRDDALPWVAVHGEIPRSAKRPD